MSDVNNSGKIHYEEFLPNDGMVKVVCDERNFMEALLSVEYIHDRLLAIYGDKKQKILEEYKQRIIQGMNLPDWPDWEEG
jgi:hypothetical protein